MRINSIQISNFRGIRHLELADLRDLVVIAGPNGIGKSTVFDAIRLLKGAYGGYAENEAQQWFAEFQLDLRRTAGLAALQRDQTKDMSISARLSLSSEEIDYIRATSSVLAEFTAWTQSIGMGNIGERSTLQMAIDYPHMVQQVRAAADGIQVQILSELEYPFHDLEVFTSIHGLQHRTSLLFSTLFANYDPDHIGIVDYHSAQRNYSREQVGGLNLSSDVGRDLLKNHALYNSQNKYANVKTELLSTYIRGLLSDRARANGDEPTAHVGELDETLKELFRAFIPQKEYEGIQATSDGSAHFPVKLSDGTTHDINDLSSGEKELLYGYLRIRNSTPRHSVILIDEPELHLNPALASALPGFYFENFVQNAGDKVWFVTHSDALLRSAIESPKYSVIHMRPATDEIANQATILSDDTIELAIASLVGDISTYRPGLRVLFLEGGGDKEFDRMMILRLFPELANSITLVPAGSKTNVIERSKLWERISKSAHRGDRFWSLTDMDDVQQSSDVASGLSWDRYHIENYLLEPQYIADAVRALTLSEPDTTPSDVYSELQAISEEVKAQIVRQRVIRILAGEINGASRLGGDPNSSDVFEAIWPSVESASRKLTLIAERLADRSGVRSTIQGVQEEFDRQLARSEWFQVVPGRPILQRFAAARGLNYGYLVPAIIEAMARARYQPAGMVQVLRAITEDV